MYEELQLFEVDKAGELEDDLLGEHAEALALPPHELVLVLAQADQLAHRERRVLRRTLEDAEVQRGRRLRRGTA